MARAHSPGPKPKYGGRTEKRVRISREVAALIDKESTIHSFNQGKPVGISDVVERIFRQHYELQPEEGQAMLINKLEQIIDQLPSREFSYTYSTGTKITLKHDTLWRGEVTGVNNLPPCNASTFQEVSNSLTLYGWTDQSKQELLSAAMKQLASEG